MLKTFRKQKWIFLILVCRASVNMPHSIAASKVYPIAKASAIRIQRTMAGARAAASVLVEGHAF
jgi:hypothetical protein